MNKNHIITKAEFRKSLKNFLALSEKDIDMLVPRFFVADEDLTYDTCVSFSALPARRESRASRSTLAPSHRSFCRFMSTIHEYSDKSIRAQ